MRQIPNILSGIRVLLVGLFALFFRAGDYVPALCVFVFAFVTDVLDGQLARQYGWESNLGKLLDPLADKLMTVTALVCIYLVRRQPIYLALFLVMLVKELLMLIGSFLMVKRNVVASADWPGKVATGFFAVGIVLALVSFVSVDVNGWDVIFLTGATAMSCFALVFYGVRQFRGALRAQKTPTGKAPWMK